MCDRLYWVAVGSLRGWLSVYKDHRSTGKCDKLSLLRVCLSQVDCVLGGTNGYALLLEGG